MRKQYILYATTTILSLLTINNTSALSYSSDVNISFTFSPTLSVSISPSDLVISNLTPGTTDTSNEISVNIATNNFYGYKLYATVGSNTTAYNSTNLTHTNGVDAFSSLSPAASFTDLVDFTTNATDNTWGYTYSLDNGTTWSKYNGLPIYNTDSPTRLVKTTELSEDTIDFKIAAKSGPTQASGTYANIINFTAITNLAPLSLAESYESYYQKTGKTKLDGYYVMQDMNKEICDNAEIIDSELQVIDNRNHKVYWIAKLKDDHCWMTQNLDLDLISDPTAENYVALTSENTDLNEYGDHNYTSQYGYSIDSNDVITWVPTNTTTTFTGASMDNWISSDAAPSSASKTDDTNTGHLIYGNWYNWPAAIASNNSAAFNTETYENPANNPKNSICPKGWRLPIITAYSTTEPGGNDFNNLNYYYNNGSTSTNAGLRKAPLYFRNSSYAPNLIYIDSMMLYWSSTSIITYYSLGPMSMQNSWGGAPGYNKQGSSNGFSVRCLSH